MVVAWPWISRPWLRNYEHMSRVAEVEDDYESKADLSDLIADLLMIEEEH
jgi:hypothetical protein